MELNSKPLNVVTLVQRELKLTTDDNNKQKSIQRKLFYLLIASFLEQAQFDHIIDNIISENISGFHCNINKIIECLT